MDSAEFDEIEYKNVLPALTIFKDYDSNDRDDEGYEDDEYDRDQNGFRSNRGRMLYCRKCEGHGIQILLKGHTALCPYVNCQCKSCDRLMRMRKSAFIRRYRSTLSSMNDTNSAKLKITPVRLFENTNTRFAIARDDISDSADTGVLPFSLYNSHITSAASQVASNFSALSLGSVTEPLATDLVLSDNQKCSTSSRRDFIRPLDLSIVRERSMAPTSGTVAGPILTQRDGILGQAQHHQQISPAVASNNFQSKMISELSPPQRDLFSLIQGQHLNPASLEAFHQQQQLAQLHAFQQQQQQQQQMNLAQQPPQNRGGIPNGNMSPPRVPLPLAMQPPSQQPPQLRPKRHGQAEAFQQNEPVNKRSTAGFLSNLTPQMQQQLNAMNNPQQMALLQQVQQQQLQQQQLQQQQQQQQLQQHHQNMPTSAAAMQQLSAFQGRLPQPARLPFSGAGFAPPPQPAYNPPNSVISTNETLQNQLRILQAGQGIAHPPNRPPFSESSPMDVAGLIMATSNGQRVMDELKRLGPQAQVDQNQFLGQFLRQEEMKIIQAQKNQQQQQQQQQQNIMQAIAQQHQQQQQQQQNQRRQSLPAPVPTSFSNLLAQVAANQAACLPLTSVCNTMPSPSKEVPSAASSSSATSANNLSPIQQQQQQQQPSNASNGIRASPPILLGPGEVRYQLFLHSIDMFNRGIVQDKDSLTQRYEIPEKIAEAAFSTHRAQIPVPNPSMALDHPALRSHAHENPTSSASGANQKTDELSETPEQ